MDTKLNYFWTGKNHLEIEFQGEYRLVSNGSEKEKLFSELYNKSLQSISINSKHLGKWDSSLIIILYDVMDFCKKNKIKADLSGLPKGLVRLLNLAFKVEHNPARPKEQKKSFLENLGQKTVDICNSFIRGMTFLKDSLFSIGRFFGRKAVMRRIDFLFALEDCSYKAFGIVALISFMVGLIFGFVGAMELRLFGAEIYVASLVGFAMVRVMGAMMAGIIIAGRTGSSYAATIGTMQVNEEIDAMKTMGIPVIDFLLLPRMMALVIMMPFLTLFADVVGMMGGAFVGIVMLGLSPQEYWQTTVDILKMRHFFVGLFHGFVFGCVISICGCYFGLNCGRDADSVGKAATDAVVYSIVWIIVCTAVITIICEEFGI